MSVLIRWCVVLLLSVSTCWGHTGVTVTVATGRRWIGIVKVLIAHVVKPQLLN